jgi:hypothetical protein
MTDEELFYEAYDAAQCRVIAYIKETARDQWEGKQLEVEFLAMCREDEQVHGVILKYYEHSLLPLWRMVMGEGPAAHALALRFVTIDLTDILWAEFRGRVRQ